MRLFSGDYNQIALTPPYVTISLVTIVLLCIFWCVCFDRFFHSSQSTYGNLGNFSFRDILLALKRAVVFLHRTQVLAIAASILGYSLCSLANSVFSEFPRQNETDRSLYFSAGNGRPFVVVR